MKKIILNLALFAFFLVALSKPAFAVSKCEVIGVVQDVIPIQPDKYLLPIVITSFDQIPNGTKDEKCSTVFGPDIPVAFLIDKNMIKTGDNLSKNVKIQALISDLSSGKVIDSYKIILPGQEKTTNASVETIKQPQKSLLKMITDFIISIFNGIKNLFSRKK